MTYENFTIVPKPKQSSFIDLEGQTFGMLTVLGYLGTNKRRDATWLCRCECGLLKVAVRRYLRDGITTSCGCQKAIKVGNSKRTHGQYGTPTYISWSMMIQRCTNPNNTEYATYGGQGVTVCDRWRHSFSDFFADMGERPSDMTIDRINNKLGYVPDNCRWATDETQANNKSNNRHLTYQDKTQTIAQWSKEMNLDFHVLYRRLESGWSIEKALTQPVRVLRPRANVALLSDMP